MTHRIDTKLGITLHHISDTHAQQWSGIDIPADTDILIHSGDATNYHDLARNSNEWNDFIEWYGNLSVPIKIYVPGNHDSTCYYENKKVRRMCKDAGIDYLNKDTLTIYDLNFYGDPTTPTFGNWHFTTDRSKTKKHWDLIPENTNILITHGPAKGFLDLSYHGKNLEFCGDSSLKKAIDKLPNLKLHCSGHIHCLTPDYEVLTDNGWKFYKDISLTDKVFNYNEINKSLEYDNIEEIIVSEYEGDMYSINNSTFSLDASPKHKIVHFDKDELLTYSTVENIFQNIKTDKGIKIPVVFDYIKEDYAISDLEIRLMVWVAADGSREGNRWRFHLKKERKISRLKKLLEELSIEFNTGILSKKGSVKISFLDSDFKYSKPLSKEVIKFSRRQCRIFINEYLHTDGNFTKSLKFPKALGQLSSSKVVEVDILMEMLIKSGYKSIGYIKPNHRNFHCNINVADESVKYISIRKNHISKYNYSGIIWCLKTTNNNFIIRKKGKIMLTGNSSRDVINTGVREHNGIFYSNASAVKDGEFDKGIQFNGNTFLL